MKSVAVRLSSKYQVVIPKEVRECLALRPKATLLFVIDGDTVTLRPKPEDFTRTLQGLHRELWPDAEQWLEEERRTWQ